MLSLNIVPKQVKWVGADKLFPNDPGAGGGGGGGDGYASPEATGIGRTVALVALVAVGAGGAYYLLTDKKRGRR